MGGGRRWPQGRGRGEVASYRSCIALLQVGVRSQKARLCFQKVTLCFQKVRLCFQQVRILPPKGQALHPTGHALPPQGPQFGLQIWAPDLGPMLVAKLGTNNMRLWRDWYP